MSLLSALFGSSINNEEIKEKLNNNAIVLDVRSTAEFAGGHVAGSKNIPLNEITARLDEIKAMKQPLVLCCASGGRSGQAFDYLSKQGIDCINGGGWTNVNKVINQ